MASLLEQALSFSIDIVAMLLMEKKDATAESMQKSHTGLEGLPQVA